MGLCRAISRAEADRTTLEACRRGDREAFRQLFEAYKDRVYSLALYHFEGDESAARDAAQQVFLKLFTAMASFRGECEFGTWLFRIVRNCCLDQRRSGRHDVGLEDTGPALTCGASQEHDYAVRQTAESVRAAVRGLRPALRWPILLRYFEELSYRDIGAVLHCSEGTVASRLSRAHRLLADKLAPLRERAPRGK